MQWSEYSRMAGGLYTPEVKQMASNRSKLVVAEGLSEKNLLKMPGKLSPPVRSMENDLRRFVTGKPILNEVVQAAIPALVAAAETAVPATAAAATGAAATGAATGSGAAATGAATGSVAGGTAAATNLSASSLASDAAVGDFVSNVVSNTNVGDTSQTSHPNEQEVKDEN
jgi:hypothetical protein